MLVLQFRLEDARFFRALTASLSFMLELHEKLSPEAHPRRRGGLREPLERISGVVDRGSLKPIFVGSGEKGRSLRKIGVFALFQRFGSLAAAKASRSARAPIYSRMAL